jgi:hypothetical protein
MCSIDTGQPVHARAARDAIPDHLLRHGRRNDRIVVLREHLVADAHDHELRREDLAGRERRTRVLAATALGAREAIQHLFERQVLGGADAEAELLLGDGVVVELQRLETPTRPGPPEPHVDRGAEDVQVLGVRQVREEPEDRQHVRPHEHALEHFRPVVVAEHVRQQLRHRRPPRGPVA